MVSTSGSCWLGTARGRPGGGRSSLISGGTGQCQIIIIIIVIIIVIIIIIAVIIIGRIRRNQSQAAYRRGDYKVIIRPGRKDGWDSQ